VEKQEKGMEKENENWIWIWKRKIENENKGKKESEGKEEKTTMQINKEERRRWIEITESVRLTY